MKAVLIHVKGVLSNYRTGRDVEFYDIERSRRQLVGKAVAEVLIATALVCYRIYWCTCVRPGRHRPEVAGVMAPPLRERREGQLHLGDTFQSHQGVGFCFKVITTEALLMRFGGVTWHSSQNSELLASLRWSTRSWRCEPRKWLATWP